MEILGWLGSICFALSAFPQALLAFRQGHSNGVASSMLALWLVGEVCTLIYVLPKGDLPLLFNYLTNLSLLLVIIRYKVWPRTKSAVSTEFTISPPVAL